MPAKGKEIPTLFTGFLGTNISVDPATLPSSVLQRSQNWIPSPAYTLIKRPGIRSINLDAPFATDVVASTRFTYQAHRYTFIVSNRNESNDTVAVAVDAGQFLNIVNARFDITGWDAYDFALYGGNLYCSNGLHPIKRIAVAPVSSTATDLSPLNSFTDATGAPVLTTDPGAQLLTGTYSYVWAVYDDTTKQWVARGDTAKTVDVTVSGDKAITFSTPGTASYTLVGGQKFHLFVAPVNLPIEYAHDQTPAGTLPTFITVRAITVEQTPVPMLGFITRRGKYLLAHRGRIWAANDQTDPDFTRRVYATNILLPGYEQAIFDQGDFFPANAVIQLPLEITGMGIVSLTGTPRSPQSPLALFTQTSTWLWMGDILDDPNADLVQRSDRVGCTSHHAIATTPLGLIFPGVESVYLLSPDGALTDIGWPIRDAIRAITPSKRHRMLSVYHEGFYKLALPPDGELDNHHMWWLDLRRGLGSVPSWWGPHVIATATAYPATWCLGTDETTVDERLFSWSSDGLGSEHDLGTTDRGVYFTAKLTTGLVDLDAPFTRKLATRVRVVARPGSASVLTAAVIADQASRQDFGTLDLPVSGAHWRTSQWRTGVWGHPTFQEGTAWGEADRLRGQAFAVELTHASPQAIELRHGELALLPIDRSIKESF